MLEDWSCLQKNTINTETTKNKLTIIKSLDFLFESEKV